MRPNDITARMVRGAGFVVQRSGAMYEVCRAMCECDVRARCAVRSSAKKCVERLTDRPDAYELTFSVEFNRIDIGLGEHQPMEPHLDRLSHAERGLGDRADFTRKTHLSEHRRRWRNDAVADARGNRRE